MADTTKKIIRGVVNSRGFTITSPITQWDYGWQFIPEIEDLPATYRLDFSNDEHHGTALPVYCSTDGAEVPTELIDTGKDVWVWFVRIGEGYGITEYKWRIPNKCKPKTEQDEPTPSQQSSIDQLIVRSNEAVETAEQSASDADVSAQNASADAERAEEARTDAQNYATQAEQSATDAHESASQASASATASAQSASQSAQIKADVEALVATAVQAVQDASHEADLADASARSASASANSASASATSAEQYASQAQASANTASNKAIEASGYATTASDKATESAQSATNANQSAQTAEQAKVDSQTAQGLAESARDSAISAKTDAESAKADAESARDEAVNAVASISGALDDKADVITDTASGAIASFTDGADDIPLKSLVVDINPVQDLSQGDPSPENICPISGWTGMNLRRCNENLWDDAWYSLGNTMTKVVDETSDFYGYYSGSVKTWSSAQQSNGLTKLFPYGVDRLTVTAELGSISTSSGFTFRIIFYYSDGTSEYDHNIVVASRSKKTETRVSQSGKKCTGFAISTNAGTGNPNGAVRRIMVSVDGTTDFIEPVQNPITPITFGQTVYGGKLDVLSGVMSIEWAGVDLATLSGWVNNMGGQNAIEIRCTLTGKKEGRTNIISNMLKTGTETSATDSAVFSIRGYPTSSTVAVKVPKTVAQDSSEVVTWIANNHPMACYELAEPIEIQLTPHEVNSLLGVNNIFADTGDTEVEYRANTKLYVNKKIAEALASLT